MNGQDDMEQERQELFTDALKPGMDPFIVENFIQASIRKKRRKKAEILEDNLRKEMLRQQKLEEE